MNFVALEIKIPKTNEIEEMDTRLETILGRHKAPYHIQIQRHVRAFAHRFTFPIPVRPGRQAEGGGN